MMAITTNNSIRVKAPIFLRMFFIIIGGIYLYFWQTDREHYQGRPRCQPELSIPLAMRMPEAVYGEMLRKSHVAPLGRVRFSRILREAHAFGRAARLGKAACFDAMLSGLGRKLGDVF